MGFLLMDDDTMIHPWTWIRSCHSVYCSEDDECQTIYGERGADGYVQDYATRMDGRCRLGFKYLERGLQPVCFNLNNVLIMDGHNIVFTGHIPKLFAKPILTYGLPRSATAPLFVFAGGNAFVAHWTSNVRAQKEKSYKKPLLKSLLPLRGLKIAYRYGEIWLSLWGPTSSAIARTDTVPHQHTPHSLNCCDVALYLCPQ